jgi:hypothetical protein
MLTRTALLVASLVAAATPSLASDGVLEINQTCALSGAGCFPGDAGGGFPVEITATEQSYRLTSSLQVPDADTTAIWVQATNANVAIDLNGFTIRGVTVCSGLPITSCAPTGIGIGVLGSGAIQLRNGFVSQMGGDGVHLGDWSSVEGVAAERNGGDGIAVGARSRVAGCRSARNGGRGIVSGVDGSLMGNLVSGNNQLGILLGLGSGFGANTIAGNAAGVYSGGVSLSDNVCNGSTTCSCTPGAACAGLCGNLPDGCGGSVNCSTSGGVSCTGFNTCGGGGTPNQCGCTPTGSCGASQICGTVQSGCGTQISCGVCPSNRPVCCFDLCVANGQACP